MKRILYVISMDWDAIKQRPQFLAEELAKYFIIDVVERVGLSSLFKFKKFQKKTTSENLSLRCIFSPAMVKLELLDKYGIVDFINGLLFILTVRLNKYDYIYIGNCQSYKPFRLFLSKKTKLIYDCMDDEKEFPGVRSIIQYNPKIEKELVCRADYMFCTSEYLKNKILHRNNIKRNIAVVNNGIGLPNDTYQDSLPDNLKAIEELHNVILYIGAIAPWFDFEAILYVLEQNDKLNVVLVGPTHDVEIPSHPRIHTLGSCEHKYIFTLMSYAKILVMPFVVNELIRSVNPVKLYEYIYSCKPVIASRYGESEKFKPYVELYSNKEEFWEITNRLLSSESINNLSPKDFVVSNTWKNRAKHIRTIITSEKL